jgi:hypothetical protein
MPDGVDARVQAMQPSRVKPMLDGPFSDAERSQLPPSHHPMLPPSKLRHPSIGPPLIALRTASLSQRSYSGGGDGLDGHVLMLAGNIALVVRDSCRLSCGKGA